MLNINSALIRLDVLPSPKPELPAAAQSSVGTFLNWTMGAAAVVVLFSLIIGGIMIAVSQRRGEPTEKLAYVVWPIIAAVVAMSASGIAKVLFNL
ncbi:hypothetical protein MBO12_02435 [Candidatus Saccharibacteria bacterium]|nr:hypothetical protein [Candidatus Saccharibacteria bacterium]